ncbi:MAG: hypothetical protein R3C11_03675 [Planctomycetaceae bacterium]
MDKMEGRDAGHLQPGVMLLKHDSILLLEQIIVPLRWKKGFSSLYDHDEERL